MSRDFPSAWLVELLKSQEINLDYILGLSYEKHRANADKEAIIREESLNAEKAKLYMIRSLEREYASENGTELKDILPKMSPLNPKYLKKKKSVFQKIADFVAKFKGVGGEI